MRNSSAGDLVRYNEYITSKYRRAAELSYNHIEKIKNQRSTTTISYASMPEPFDYVHKKFPSAGVKLATVYKVKHNFLEQLGYKGVGGFFTKIGKIIVIPNKLDIKKSKDKLWSSIVAKVTIDEILTHELLHFASFSQYKNTLSVELEEEFAYGNSIEYLRNKGHSDMDIINNNFMPYLINTVDKGEIIYRVLAKNGMSIGGIKNLDKYEFNKTVKSHEKEILIEAKKEAVRIGINIINIYEPKETKKAIKIEDNTFSFIDL